LDFADAFAFTGAAGFTGAFAAVFAGAFAFAVAAAFAGAFAAAAFTGVFALAGAAGFTGAFAATAFAGAFVFAGAAGFMGFLSSACVNAEAATLLAAAGVLVFLSNFDALLATAFDVFSLLAISQILLQQIRLNQRLYQRMIRLTSQ
jgi:hypothetical protein